MKNRKIQKRIIILLLILLIVTVGYALLSQQLKINGNTKVNKNTWNIHWDNVVVNTNSVSGSSVTKAATITNTEKTLVEYSITLSEPGEFYEFTVDAKNEGTIDGMVNVVSNKVYESNGTTEKTLPNYLTYSVTYSDGKTISQKHLLKAGESETYKVRVEFKDVEASQLPTSEETLKFKFSVEYIQADSSGEEVDHRFTGTKYRTLPEKSVYIGDNISTGVTLFDSVNEAKNAFSNRKFYLKHTIENDIVKESYVCFEKNNNTYCLRGQQTSENGTCKDEYYDAQSDKCISTYYESNKQILKEVFGENNCILYSSFLDCGSLDLNAGANENGTVNVYVNSTYCHAYGNGNSSCYE